MANSVTTKCHGLYTFQNFLSSIPEGSLLDATNVVIDRDGIIEPRRGIKPYGTFGSGGDIAKQLLTYKNRVLVHYSNSIAYDDGTGTFTPFNNSYIEVDAGLRIKYIEANSNLYFTTSTGIKKIAANSSTLSAAKETFAGGIKALDGTAIIDYSVAGFLTGLSKVAYRIVWGTLDVNKNLILGAPSMPINVTNFSWASGNVKLTFNVPANITTDYFYQIYRTEVAPGAGPGPGPGAGSLAYLNTIDAGDEMKLIMENPYLSGTSITVTDNVPQYQQKTGTFLYTNGISGEGILQANTLPPVSKDIALFKNSAFYANIRTVQSMSLTLLGVHNYTHGAITNIVDHGTYATITSPLHGLSNGDIITIVGTGALLVDAPQVITYVDANTFTIPVSSAGALTTGTWFGSYINVFNGVTTNRYFFVGSQNSTKITFDTQANTLPSSYFNIYSANNLVHYAVWFDTTGNDPAPTVSGAVLIRVDISAVGSQNSTKITFDTQTNTADGSYFNIYSANNLVHYAVWFDKTGSTAAPTVPGAVLIRVDISAVPPGTNVAPTVQTAILAATNDFTRLGTVGIVEAPLGTLTFITALNGPTTNATAGTPAPGGAFTIGTIVLGSTVNIAPAVRAAILAETNDFSPLAVVPMIITGNTINFIPAENGPAFDATPSTPAPGGAFAIGTIVHGFGENASKNYVLLSALSPGQAIAATSQSLISVINQNAAESIYGYYTANLNTMPGLMQFERRTVVNTNFTIQANSAIVGASFVPDLTTLDTSVNEIVPNRVYFSKYQQPEAVPIVNYLDVGPKDKAILRIVPLRDSLFIFKEDGIYRLTGDIAPNFSVILFDNSIHLIAPDTAAVLNNQIYALTDGGVATVTETGVGIISRPIENVFNRLYTTNFPNFSKASFGIGYETERSYYVWTVTNTTDTYATQCFRYNTFTQCWTRWDKAQTCVVLNSFNNKLHLGSPTTNIVEVERKSLTRTDYADREIALSIPPNGIKNLTTLELSSVVDLVPGDAIVQTQYVTINLFNTLLLKLDMDPRIGVTPGTFDTNYAALLTMNPGDDLSNKLISLVTKLNADPGTDQNYTFTGSSNFVTIQGEYNAIIIALNVDSKLKFANYQSSTGTYDFELTIDGINKALNQVTSLAIPAFMVGNITGFKGIQSKIIWAPNSGGDPSMLKHYREGTMLFETSAFRSGVISYNSDLSPSMESIPFSMDGSGTWGGFIWGASTWGGGGTSVPFRTYIPRQKQRCRYIRCQLVHHDAFYKYSVLGISYAFDVSSDRAYRGRA